ncbi:MAG: sigma-70 family RNA polymerase sigma factor [Pseudomonadota bacterium]
MPTIELVTHDSALNAAPALPDGDAVSYAPTMTAAPEDTALMLRFGEGDSQAFEELYRRHNDALYRYFLRLGSDPATAEDLYQEAWSKIIRARASYRPTAKFTTYLYRVAHNCFIDNIRRNKRHRHTAQIEPDTQAADCVPPEAAAETGLARRRLERALEDLPFEQRDAFLLHEEAGLGLDDIARVTGANREAAKSRLRYAVKKLRAALDDAEDSK